MKPNRLMLALAAAVMAVFVATSAALAVGAVATAHVNVRTGPSTAYQVVDTLYPGEPVEVTQCQSGWCYVQHTGPDGWVSGNYLNANQQQPQPQPPQSGDPDCNFGVHIGPGGPNFSIQCGNGHVSPPQPSPRACFYDHAGYGGASFCVHAGQSDPSLSGFWNNRISSVRLFGGARVTLCRNFGYGGFCRTLNSSEASLGGFLNNDVSSYRTF